MSDLLPVNNQAETDGALLLKFYLQCGLEHAFRFDKRFQFVGVSVEYRSGEKNMFYVTKLDLSLQENQTCLESQQYSEAIKEACEQAFLYTKAYHALQFSEFEPTSFDTEKISEITNGIRIIASR